MRVKQLAALVDAGEHRRGNTQVGVFFVVGLDGQDRRRALQERASESPPIFGLMTNSSTVTFGSSTWYSSTSRTAQVG
jgi:hypothetical protein